jgi:hypothetical protein
VLAQVPHGYQQISIKAFLGKISPPRVEPNGRVTAQYLPPEGFTPAVDIIAIMARQGDSWTFGYAALPLVGQGTAIVRTRPRAEAVIEIGPASFGPVRANQTGIAEIPVEVHPGISCGYDNRQRPVDLGAPRQAAAALFPVPRVATLRPGDSAKVFGVLVAEDGSLSPELGSKFNLTTSMGSATLERQDPDGVLLWNIETPFDRDGALTVTLGRLEAPTVSIELEVTSPPPPPPPPPPSEEIPPPPKALAFQALSLGATAGISGTFGDALGPWLGVALGLRARLHSQSVHAQLNGMLFIHDAALPLEGLSDGVQTGLAQTTTLLFPILLGLGWTGEMRQLWFAEVNILGGVGIGRTLLKLPEELGSSQNQKLYSSVGPSFGARVGVGRLLGRTRLRADAGYQWTGPDETLAPSPGLSLWSLSLSCDVDFLRH